MRRVYNFGRARAFAQAFAWHEAQNGRRARVERVAGAWRVLVG